MPLPPAIPFGGLAGLQFLERTFDRQFANFSQSADLQREIDYFLENAGSITTAEELVGDRRLLSVALGAFGLDEDINKGAFIRKILEEGTFDERAFANRLVEPAYKEMSAFLGFGDFGSVLGIESRREEIVERFRERQFEIAVGEQDFDLRVALNFRREVAAITESASENTILLRLLGSPPLRSFIEGALNLPSEVAQIDLDRQVEEVEDRLGQILGDSSPSILKDPAAIDTLIKRFMLNSQLQSGAIGTQTRGSAALSLLQSSGFGAGAQTNLFLSGL